MQENNGTTCYGVKTAHVPVEVIAFKSIATICKVHGGVHTATNLKQIGVDANPVHLSVETVATGVEGVANTSPCKVDVEIKVKESEVHKEKPVILHQVVESGPTDETTHLR